MASNRKEFKDWISPEPISACDLLKALLKGDRKLKQNNNQSPPIPIDAEEVDVNHWQRMHPIMQRADCACKLGMVINPISLFGNPTRFISKEEFSKCYKVAEEQHMKSWDRYLGAPVIKPKIW